MVLAIAVVACAGLGATLLARERGGPSHRDVTLPGDVPATFYLPEDDAPPPAIVVGHGYSGDRATMSTLSRSLAGAGYAVLAIDFRGHGVNPHGAAEGNRVDDLTAGLDWLERSDEVDGERLVVLGHSMGAHAAVDLLVRDPRPSAAVILGGASHPTLPPDPPRNVLFLVASLESPSVGSASEGFAADIEDAGGNARVETIGGANHITMLWFDETVAQTVGWLDDVFGIERDETAGIADPRLPVGIWFLVTLPLAIAGLGLAAARLGPRAPEAPASPAAALVFVAVALAAALPVASLLEPAAALGEAFGAVVSYLVVAGAILYLPQIRTRPKPAPAKATLARLGAATAASTTGAFLLVAPVGGVFHNLVPTPPRVMLAVVMAPLLGVFFVQVQAKLRRGSLVHGATASTIGHFLVLVGLGGGVVLGVFPDVVGLALPLLAGVFVLVEVYGAAAYSVTRSGVLVGLVEAVWVAGIAAVSMPLPS